MTASLPFGQTSLAGPCPCSGGLRRSKERTHITIAEASHRLEETSKKDMEPSISRRAARAALAVMRGQC